MYQSIHKLCFITIILFALASCHSSRKVSSKVKANVIENEDSSSTVAFVLDTVKIYDTLQIEYGDKLGVAYDSIYNLKLFGYVKENLGKKCFGNKKDLASCESFLTNLFKEVYSIDFPNSVAAQMKYKNLELFKDSSYLRLSDLLFFNYNLKQPDKISHVGLYLFNKYFLIASYNDGVVITKLDHPYWRKHFVAAGRINKLSDIETELSAKQ